jgi:hypothetical protein
MWSDQIVHYYSQLKCPDLPERYSCMNPYKNADTMKVVLKFAHKYLNDKNQRTLLFGINPGRFGSGITGISFTDPVRLKEELDIEHNFEMRPELSSQFIYAMIKAYGGPRLFYQDFFISAAYPLGFLKDGKNINYYEFDQWKEIMLHHIVNEMNAHMEFNVNREVCYIVGRGENFKVLKALNAEHRWFKKVKPLPHPRWILQYKRKQEQEHITNYIRELSAVVAK